MTFADCGGLFELEAKMEELKQTIEQQNQRIAQLERILNLPCFNSRAIDWQAGKFDSAEEMNQLTNESWHEILSKLNE
jgi:hypothetical protein